MGEVFLARDERLNREVAIKRLRSDRSASDVDRLRFRREAQAAAGLQHPAIVQIFDILEEPSGDCIVMEYVEGSTVAELTKAGPLPLARIVDLARQVSVGLRVAHARGLVHRDLKAENVVVTSKGDAKILDFGIAKPAEAEGAGTSLTTVGTLLGTSRSMSPEQAGGETVDHRSDLFSLGVLLYEMVAARSPFLDDSPLKTIKNVLTGAAEPLTSLRPDVPPRLEALIGRLLRKDPAERPQNADEVIRELDLIDLELPSREPRDPTDSVYRGRVAPGRPATGFGWLTGRLAASALVVAAGIWGLFFWMSPGPPKQALRVAVVQPVFDSGQANLRLTASNVMEAALNTLISLQGLSPIDSAGAPVEGMSAVGIARALAADEVLGSTIEADRDWCRVTFRRVKGETGEVVSTQSFRAALAAPEARTLADAVQVRLRELYAQFPLEPGFPKLEAGSEDYSAYLDVKLRINSGEGDLEGLLQRLDQILLTSPRFPAALDLATDLARSLYSRTGDKVYYQRGLGYIERAARLTPSDPRPLVQRIRFLHASKQFDQAETALRQYQAEHPGDPEFLALLAENQDKRGHPAEALATMLEVVKRTPSWQNHYLAGDLQYRIGQVDPARTSLLESLRLAPGNRWALSRLGTLELVYGDLGRAEELFTELSQSSDSRSAWTNLGLSRFLQSRYGEAVEAYQQALRLSPEHMAVELNLADAYRAAGDAARADSLYRQLLARLEGVPDGQKSPIERMMQAQCLAHTGRHREAVEFVQETLAGNPDSSEVFYLAALVYALAGERTSALVNAEKALEKGYQPRWFDIPAFDSLRGEAEFSDLLKRPAAAPDSR